MLEIEIKTRKWGNSLGLTIPKAIVRKERIKENDILRLLIVKKDNILDKTFGMLKDNIKEPTQDIKDRLRKELYNE